VSVAQQDQQTGFEVIRQRVVDWLTVEGFKVTKAPANRAEWGMVAEVMGDRRVLVFQMPERPDALFFEGLVQLADDYTLKISSLEPRHREALMWDLRLELLRFDIDHKGIEQPLRQVAFQSRLYVEDLTRTSFMDMMRKLIGAHTMVLYLLARAVSEPPPDPGLMGMIH
jgi:hypothetical protein